ncbi:hypothetical protein ACIOD2_49560 [Amycolatopsis sp. NPDC088138]|uniref:hypothetical protein n=1 Tax=Amycolatopsis sp. NPDC088138 TaxID=3363938 RepID=UPI0037FB566E
MDAVVVFEPELGMNPAAFVSAWSADVEAAKLGEAVVRPAGRGEFGFEWVEWVAIPLAVNLASSAVYDVVKRVVSKLRTRDGVTARPPDALPSAAPATIGLEWEVVATVTAEGAPLVIVRASTGSR